MTQNSKRTIYFLKRVGVYFLSICTVVTVAYFIFISDVFKVQNIIVEPEIDGKLHYIESADVERNLRNFYGRNILFITKSGVTEFLMENFSYIKHVSIDFNLPGKMNVSIDEKNVVGKVFQYSGHHLSLVDDGDLLEFVNPPNDAFNLYVVSSPIYDTYTVTASRYGDIFQSLEEMGQGSTMFDKNAMKLLSDLSQSLDIAGSKPKYFTYFPIENEIHAILDNNVSIWFNVDSKISMDMDKFKLSLEIYSGDISKILYIDNRVKEKVLVCYKISPCSGNEHYLIDVSPKLLGLTSIPLIK